MSVNRVMKPAKAIVDFRRRFIGPIVMDPARAARVCREKNEALRKQHPEYVADVYCLADCFVEVVV